jgi:AhpD family alkylhydroperoxidase
MTEPRRNDIDEIIARMNEEVGFIPPTMQYLMEHRPEVVEEHARSKKFVLSRQSIPDKYKQLIIIAAAAAAGAPKCVETQTRIAIRKGISPDEIVDALLLARFALSSTVFANAADALKVAYEGEGSAE